MSKKLNRRDFLKMSAATGAALAVGPVAQSAFAAPAQRRESMTVYWHPGHSYDSYAEIVEQFTDETGMDVNWEMYQWPDMRTKILADFAAGDVPDLVEEPGGQVQEFALTGNIQSMDPWIATDGGEMGFPEDWQEYTVNRNSIDGSVYGVQLHLTCTLIFYNIDMLEEAGYSEPPATWDEFLEMAQATTKQRVFGFAPNQSAGYMWPWLLQNEVRQYDADTNTIPMDNADAYEAFQFVADMVHEHKVAPIPVAAADYEGPRNLFLAERAALIVTGPWDIKPVLEGNPDLNWGIAQALTRKTQATAAAGTSMMIPTEAKQPDAAWELLKRLVTIEAELAGTAEANMCMPRKSWGEHPDVLANDRVAPFGVGLGYAQDYGSELRLTGKSGEIGELFNLAYEQVIYTNASPEEALGEYVEKSNAILADD